jgi:muramoyltetrapeptide carboxypeptidase
MPYILPTPIPLHARIGIFSAAGAVVPERLAMGVRALETLGHQVIVAPEATLQWRYFAGTDAERVASFHALLAEPSFDCLMMARGGYGFSRLLHLIDWDLVARAKKPIVGFSDFTAFNLAALKKSKFITFAGPMAGVDFPGLLGTEIDAETKTDLQFMNAHCWPVLRGERVMHTVKGAHPYSAQTLTGTLWGSNMSLLAHLVGTPYLPDIEGGILFIEEIDEDPYAIERMFFQLFHAGILQKQRAILLADFTDCEPAGSRFAYGMEHVLETLRNLLGDSIPVLSNLPFGHVARKLTLPFGGQAVLNIGAGEYTLQV